jgi:hypothetical protein
MALQVTFDFSGGEGDDFTVVAVTGGAETGTSVVQSTTLTSVTFEPSGLNVSFTPGPNTTIGGSPTWPYVSTDEYINWRSETQTNTHPTTGRSLDIWFANPTTPGSPQQNIQAGNDWNSLAGVRGLNANKSYSAVFYDYDNAFAYGYKAGSGAQVNITLAIV